MIVQEDYSRAMRVLERYIGYSRKLDISIYENVISVLSQSGEIDSIIKAKTYYDHLRTLNSKYENPRFIEKYLFVTADDLGRKAASIFDKIDFNYEILASSDTHIDILLSSREDGKYEYFNLGGKILARIIKSETVRPFHVDRMIQDLQIKIYGHAETNIGLILGNGAVHLTNYCQLKRNEYLETIIPMELDEWQSLKKVESLDKLQTLFKSWLLLRDYFQDHRPVAGKFYFGRDALGHKVSQLIDEGGNIGLYGLRKSGKTSFLKKITESRVRDICVYIDLQSINNDRPMDYLYWSIAHQVFNEIHSGKVIRPNNVRERYKLGKYSDFRAAEQAGSIIEMFDHDIRLTFELLDQREAKQSKIIVVLDELEVMLPISGSNPGFPNYEGFFAYFRGISQSTNGRLINVIAAANAIISELATLSKRDNPVFQFYENIFIPPLTRPECDEMIRTIGNYMSVSFDVKALENVYAQCGGHPYITRQFCSHIISRASERPLKISMQAVDKEVDNFLVQKTDIFEEILNRLERFFPLEKNVLTLIAKGHSSEVAIQREGKRYNVKKELRNLEGYGIVFRHSSKFRFKILLFKHWLRSVGEI